MTSLTSSRILRAGMLGRADSLSARQSDRVLAAGVTPDTLDSTHFDTVRFPPPKWALDSFTAAFDDGTNAYTPYRGRDSVLTPLAEHLSAFFGTGVDPSTELVLTPGSQAGLFATLSALIDPGDRVALIDPDYLFSERILTFLDASIDRVPLTTRPDGTVGPDMEILEAALAKRPALFLFSHPHNPTGAVFTPAVMSRIAALAVHYDTSVLVDQLYSRLVFAGAEFVHLRNLPGMRGLTTTLVGPSKTESLSGFRIGVVVAPRVVVDAAEDVLSMAALRAPAYAQQILADWLVADTQMVEERILDLSVLRDQTVAALRQLSWIRIQPGGGTAYVFPDVSALGVSDLRVAERLRDEAGILVSPGYQFGENGRGHFRMCFARDETQWAATLPRVVEVLRRLEEAKVG